MLNKSVGSHCLYSFLLLLTCLSGCGGNAARPGGDGTQQRFKVLTATETKIYVELSDEKKNKTKNYLSLYIGEKKWGSRPYDSVEKLLVTLETSDQMNLEGGETGSGIVFTTINSSKGEPEKPFSVASGTQNLAIVKNGLIPYGQAKIRDVASVVQTADSLILADIETPDGALIPITFRLE
ncbi:MAG: hypothetical protein QM501_15545 [Gimesia sp.]